MRLISADFCVEIQDQTIPLKFVLIETIILHVLEAQMPCRSRHVTWMSEVRLDDRKYREMSGNCDKPQPKTFKFLKKMSTVSGVAN